MRQFPFAVRGAGNRPRAIFVTAAICAGFIGVNGQAEAVAPLPKSKPVLTDAAAPAPSAKPAAETKTPLAKPLPTSTTPVPSTARPVKSANGPGRKPITAENAAFSNLKDLKAFITVLNHARENRFSNAYERLTPAMGPVARDVIDWLYFRSGGAVGEPQRILSFLESHEGWPSAGGLRNSVEAGILNGRGGRSFADTYFAKYTPRSGFGMIARGAIALKDGNAAEARKWLSHAWRTQSLTKSTESRVLKLCGNCITKADEKVRMDAMIYRDQYKAARRAAKRLGSASVRLADARIAAVRSRRPSGSGFKKVAKSLQSDLGLRHSRVRYLRRKGKRNDATKLLLGAPSDHNQLVSPGSWWTERRLLARHAVGAGKPGEAYKLATAHGYTSGKNFAEGEFLAGWIALRHLGKPKTALAHFEKLRAGVKRSLSIARAEYWLGRVKSVLGDEVGARPHIEAAAATPRSFYGQLAREQLGGTLVLLDLPPEAKATADDIATFDARPMVRAARLLGAAGAPHLAGRFVSALSYRLKSPGEYALLAKIAEGLSLPHVAVRVGKVAVSRNIPLMAAAYPLDNFPVADDASVEVALLGGLARQESEFNWRAYSRAGARGLMQIMPRTAKDISKNHNLPFSLQRLVEDPIYNLSMGEAYLGELIKRFDGSYVLAIAGYNAGPGRVGEWVEHYGDPRTSAIEPLDWIESIPFNETRAYVQRVLENLQIYRARIAGKPRLIELVADMARGRVSGKRASLN